MSHPVRHGDPCYWCKRPMRAGDPHLRPTRDHVVAKSRLMGGAKSVRFNLVWACHACNNLKGDMDLAAWYALMNQVPEWWALAEKRGPRGVDLHIAMIECGFSMPGRSGTIGWCSREDRARAKKAEGWCAEYVSRDQQEQVA